MMEGDERNRKSWYLMLKLSVNHHGNYSRLKRRGEAKSGIEVEKVG